MDTSVLPDRFWTRVVAGNGGCWVWTGGNSRGYGLWSISGRTRTTHRTTYEAVFGPVPDGLEIDHLCKNARCCNPEHLEAVTHNENMRRRKKEKPPKVPKIRTHCKRGHPAPGRCETCHKEYMRRVLEGQRRAREDYLRLSGRL